MQTHITSILRWSCAITFGMTTWLGIRLLLNARKAVNTVSNYCYINDPEPAELPKLIILLPVLREQLEVLELLQHIVEMPYAPEKLLIAVITSEREEAEKREDMLRLKQLHAQATAAGTSVLVPADLRRRFRGIGIIPSQLAPFQDTAALNELYRQCDMIETTNQLLRRHWDGIQQAFHSQIVHLHCPDRTAIKSDQLNYGICTLQMSDWTRTDATYIGVYDADSRPDSCTFMALGSDYAERVHAALKAPAAYQQCALYIRGFGDAEVLLASPVAKASAILQTRWSLGYEFPMYSGQRKLLKLRYCVGHGEFIRLDVLQTFGGFPKISFIDDIPMGNMLSFAGLEIAGLPTLDVCDFPLSVKTLIEQTGIWFAGSMAFLRARREITDCNLPLLPTWMTLCLIFSGAWGNTRWAIGGGLYTGCMIFALMQRRRAHIWLITLGIFGIATYTIVSVLYMRALLVQLSRRGLCVDLPSALSGQEMLRLVISSPIAELSRSIGALKWIIGQILVRLGYDVAPPTKTE